MGKKSGRKQQQQEPEQAKAARAFVLRVATHCHCHGCIVKIRAAVNDLTLLRGVDAVDQSALGSKGEVRLLATADPEKLRHRLRKATNKNVDLILPKDTAKVAAAADDAAHAQAQAQAQAQALLLSSLQGGHYSHGGAGAWNAHGTYGAPAYPWAVQQPGAYPAYSSYSPAAAYPWGGAGYPAQHQASHGAYAYGGDAHGY